MEDQEVELFGFHQADSTDGHVAASVCARARARGDDFGHTVGNCFAGRRFRWEDRGRLNILPHV